jgi:hypothetical protein
MQEDPIVVASEFARLAANRLAVIQEAADAISRGNDHSSIVVGGRFPSLSILCTEITFRKKSHPATNPIHPLHAHQLRHLRRHRLQAQHRPRVQPECLLLRLRQPQRLLRRPHPQRPMASPHPACDSSASPNSATIERRPRTTPNQSDIARNLRQCGAYLRNRTTPPTRIIVSIHACRATAQRRQVYSCLLFSCIQFEIDFYVVVIAVD